MLYMGMVDSEAVLGPGSIAVAIYPTKEKAIQDLAEVIYERLHCDAEFEDICKMLDEDEGCIVEVEVMGEELARISYQDPDKEQVVFLISEISSFKMELF